MSHKLLIKLQSYVLTLKYLNIEYLNLLLEIFIYSFIIMMFLV